LPSRRFLAVLLAVVLAVGLGAPHAVAWYHLRSARSALERYRPETAQSHLERCLRTWPNSVQAHLLASRAARQSGDFAEADRHRRACQRLLGDTRDDVALEWALLQAANGNVREVEEFLQAQAGEDLPHARLVWEALSEGYTRIYRIRDALACLDHWLTLDPDNLRARELRGLAFHIGKSAHRGAEDLRWVLEKDDTREATRWRLVLCLLDMGNYDEARPLLERIERHKPGDPEVLVLLARCHNMLDRPQQARDILEAVLKAHPDHAPALRTRGQLALADSQPARAEVWLRQAVRLSPGDYQANYLLLQALQQQNKTEEARKQKRITEELRDRAERLGQLRSRTLSEHPLDPALHYEMGMLLMRAGHPRVAENWLQSALSLDADYRPAHAALADHYESQGDAERAASHRRRAGK
jgi:tetratricopeptide (TPR) repeat protein